MDVDIKIVRQKRKTISARFISENVLEVRVPTFLKQSQIDDFLNRHASQIQKAQQQFLTKENKKKVEGVYYLGKLYSKNCVLSSYNRISFNGSELYIEYSSTKSAIYVLDQFLNKEAKRVLKDVLEECMGLFPTLSKPELSIRKMKTRWGTCAYRKGKITLNSKLIHVPLHCINYVVIHELLHFTYPNHQKEFHVALEKLVPNHRKVEKELHGYGFLLEE